jgi:hypothetical protein
VYDRQLFRIVGLENGNPLAGPVPFEGEGRAIAQHQDARNRVAAVLS